MQIEATDTEKGLGNEVKKLERFQDNEKKKKKKKKDPYFRGLRSVYGGGQSSSL